MASPVDSARVGTNVTTASTTHNVNVGSPTAGTLLIILARYAAAPGTITFTGYTQLVSDASDASDDTTVIFYRWADGTEGATDTCNPTNSVKAAYICWEITGAENPAIQAPETSTVQVGTAIDSANPSSVIPTGGTKDYLFLSVMGLDGEGNAPTSGSTGYSNLTTANSGTGGAAASNCSVGGCSFQNTASSENPSGFAHAAPANGCTAWVIAIHPPAPAAPGPPLAAWKRNKRLHRFCVLR